MVFIDLHIENPDSVNNVTMEENILCQQPNKIKSWIKF